MTSPSAADFLLSPAVQALLKITLAQPQRSFAVAELARDARLELEQTRQTLGHLLAAGVLVADDAAAAAAAPGPPPAGPDDTPAPDDETPAAAPLPALLRINTAQVFYPELRRIALKSFAAAEPLRAMLQSKFRASVSQAFLLGEDGAAVLQLLLVHDDDAPEKAALDQALRRLLKTGALRQHVQAQVMPRRRFAALRAGDALHAALRSDLCVDISPTSARKPRTRNADKAEPPAGLLARARRRLPWLGG